jgi:tetratricopeptide (TPR) repeat protein
LVPATHDTRLVPPACSMGILLQPKLPREYNGYGRWPTTPARAAYGRALAIWTEVYGEDHPQAAAAHNNLGDVLRTQGDLAGARAAYEQALTIFEAVMGPDHPNTQIARDNLTSLGSRTGGARHLISPSFAAGACFPQRSVLYSSWNSIPVAVRPSPPQPQRSRCTTRARSGPI